MACLAASMVGGATVADVRRTGERNSRSRQAVDGRVEGVGDATNLQESWAKGKALASMEGEEERMKRENGRGFSMRRVVDKVSYCVEESFSNFSNFLLCCPYKRSRERRETVY